MYLNNCKTFIFFDLGTISFCLSILLVFTNSNRGIFLSGGFFPIFFTILFWGISSCKKKLPKINATAFLILFLLCVTLAGLTCIFKRNVFELGQFSTFILWGSLFLLFIIHVKKYQQFYFILHSCTASGLLLSFFTIFSKEKYDLDVTRGSFRFMEQNMLDPNFLATFICLGIYATCFLLIYHKKHRIFNGFAISTMMAAVFITGSRAGFLYLCIAFVGIYFELLDLFRHDIKKKLILIISTVSFSFIIILSLYKLKPDLFQRFFLNINAYVGDGSNQKRLHHWMVALQRISDAPFWGYGTTSEKLVMSDAISDTSHNTFLSFYIRLGLLGLISFCLIVAHIFFQALKKHQYFLIFIIIGFVINIFIIPATMSYVTWISLMVFYMLNQYMDYIKITSNMRK